MAYEIAVGLIASCSAIGGAIAGTVGTSIGLRRQHERDVTASLVAEGRTRSHEAALVLTDLFDQLATDIPAHHHPGRREPEEVDAERGKRIRANSERVTALLGDLPDPWRPRLIEGWRFLTWSDYMAYDGGGEGNHYQSCGGIAHEVAAYVRLTLGAFLRNETELPPVTQRWIEYRQSYKEAKDQKELDFAHEIAEEQGDRQNWLKARPELAVALDAMDLPADMWHRE